MFFDKILLTFFQPHFHFHMFTQDTQEMQVTTKTQND